MGTASFFGFAGKMFDLKRLTVVRNAKKDIVDSRLETPIDRRMCVLLKIIKNWRQKKMEADL